MRLYRVHVVRRDGRHVIMGPAPMTHAEACTLRSKLCDRSRPFGRLVEVDDPPCAHVFKGPYCRACLAEVEAREERRDRARAS